MKTEIAIIGGGLVGCAAAYHLARKGFRVLVVEKDPSVGLQASGRNGGGVRQHGRKAALPLAMESVKLWATLAEELGADLGRDPRAVAEGFGGGGDALLVAGGLSLLLGLLLVAVFSAGVFITYLLLRL